MCWCMGDGERDLSALVGTKASTVAGAVARAVMGAVARAVVGAVVGAVTGADGVPMQEMRGTQEGAHICLAAGNRATSTAVRPDSGELSDSSGDSFSD
jgi:hypothetical protein